MKNDYVMLEDYCEIILRNNKGIEVGRTKIDKYFFDKVSKRSWYLNDNGYALTGRSVNNKIARLHRYLKGDNPGLEIDHINGDKLDNRISNLRWVTRSQNGMNKSSKGVSFYKQRGNYRAYICINKKTKMLGYFKTYIDARNARLEAEIKLFGNYSFSKSRQEAYNGKFKSSFQNSYLEI